MTGVSFIGATVLALVAAAAPGADARGERRSRARKARSARRSNKSRPVSANKFKSSPSGPISSGQLGGKSVKITNKASCEASITADAFADSASVFVEATIEAIQETCRGRIEPMVKKVEGGAVAYARAALKAAASCENEGSGTFSCANVKGSASAQATAVYEAFVDALAVAERNGELCDCALDSFAETYASIDYFNELFASALTSVDAEVCQRGEGKASFEASTECFANAVAKITAKASARAIMRGRCRADGLDLECDTECDEESCVPACEERKRARAVARAAAVLEVDTTSELECEVSMTSVLEEADGSKGSVNVKELDAEVTVSEDADFKASSRCAARAIAEGEATSASVYVETVQDALLEKCQAGVDEPTPAIDEKVAEAFASAFVDVLTRCNVKDGDTGAAQGCATAEAFSEAFATATATARAEAEASTTVAEACGCEATGITDAKLLTSFFDADLFADAVAFASADLWGDTNRDCVVGTNRVEKKVTLDCVASAMATVVAKSSARALIEGECRLKSAAQCDTCDGETACTEDLKAQCRKKTEFKSSAFAEALAEAEIELQEGFCTGNNEGGFYSFDGTTGGFECYKGCGDNAADAADAEAAAEDKDTAAGASEEETEAAADGVAAEELAAAAENEKVAADAEKEVEKLEKLEKEDQAVADAAKAEAAKEKAAAGEELQA